MTFAIMEVRIIWDLNLRNIGKQNYNYQGNFIQKFIFYSPVIQILPHTVDTDRSSGRYKFNQYLFDLFQQYWTYNGYR